MSVLMLKIGATLMHQRMSYQLAKQLWKICSWSTWIYTLWVVSKCILFDYIALTEMLPIKVLYKVVQDFMAGKTCRDVAWSYCSTDRCVAKENTTDSVLLWKKSVSYVNFIDENHFIFNRSIFQFPSRKSLPFHTQLLRELLVTTKKL